MLQSGNVVIVLDVGTTLLLLLLLSRLNLDLNWSMKVLMFAWMFSFWNKLISLSKSEIGSQSDVNMRVKLCGSAWWSIETLLRMCFSLVMDVWTICNWSFNWFVVLNSCISWSVLTSCLAKMQLNKTKIVNHRPITSFRKPNSLLKFLSKASD